MKRTTIIILLLFALCYVIFLTCVAFESRNVIKTTYVNLTDTADVEYVSIPLAEAESLTLGINSEIDRIFGGLTGELRIVVDDTIATNRLVVPKILKPYFTETADAKNVAIVVGDSANTTLMINCSVPITLYFKQLPSSISNYLTSPLHISGGTSDSLRVTTIRSLELSALTARKVIINSRYRYYNGQGNCKISLTNEASIDSLCIGSQFHNANVATDSLATIGNLVMLTPGKTSITVSPKSNIANFCFPSDEGEKRLIITSSESFQFSNNK